MAIEIAIAKLHPAAIIPEYAHIGDAGADLSSVEALTLAPGKRALVRTGVAIALPRGYVGLVHPRSGLAARSGLTIVNAPGTIDADYRGEIKVCLLNTDSENAIQIAVGDRIAQLVIQEVTQAKFNLVENLLVNTERGASGYGSTGGVTSWQA